MNYSDEVTSKIKYFQRKIVEAKQTDEDVKLVKGLFPDMYIWVDNEVNCSFSAKSMTEVKVMLKTLAENNIRIISANDLESRPVWYLQGRNVRIRLAPMFPETDVEGATCRLVKVGEEVCTYPKYKLVCDKED